MFVLLTTSLLYYLFSQFYAATQAVGRYVDDCELSEVSAMSAAASQAEKRCLRGCVLTASGEEHSPPSLRAEGRGIPPAAPCGLVRHPHAGATGPTPLLSLMLQSRRPPISSMCAVRVWFRSRKWSQGKGFVEFDTSLQWKAQMQHLASLFYSTSLFSLAI